MLTSFVKTKGRWEKTSESIIKKISNNALIIIPGDKNQNITFRYYHKTDSGFFITDFENSIITWQGQSTIKK